jgi:hypothetical protein
MALTGHLSDLSLSELIEFFCNQRKTGQLKVLYPQGHGTFHIQNGSVVDARIGALRGIEAVYFALTLPNATFEFGATSEPTERTINQPWTQVVLEGLRRLDEGLVPAPAFPAGYEKESDAANAAQLQTDEVEPEDLRVPAFLSMSNRESTGKRRFFVTGAIAVVVLGSVAAIGVPAGWYRRTPATAASQPSIQPTPAPVAEQRASNESVEISKDEAVAPAVTATQTNEAALAAKRYREMQRARNREERLSSPDQPAETAAVPAPKTPVAEPAKPGPKKITVSVTYDESGRVTQASGGDASAVRIARQKRFPAGKAGSATITIPIN